MKPLFIARSFLHSRVEIRLHADRACPAPMRVDVQKVLFSAFMRNLIWLKT